VIKHNRINSKELVVLLIGILILVIISSATLAHDNIPALVRDTPYDYRCLEVGTTNATNYSRLDTAVVGCQKKKLAAPTKDFIVQAGTYRVELSGVIIVPPPPPPPVVNVPTLTGWLVEGWKNNPIVPPAGMPTRAPDITLTEMQTIGYASTTTVEPLVGLGNNYYAMRYRRKFVLDAGEWAMNVSSDDGVRVYLDSVLIYESWRNQAQVIVPVKFTVASAGEKTITVDHFEGDWIAGLTVTTPIKVTPPVTGNPLPSTSGPLLSVSPNSRYMRLDGQPYYWLADTAWGIEALTTSEITQYLQDRSARGLRVIHGPIIIAANVSDYTGYLDKATMTLKPSGWVKADWAIQEAGRLGMAMSVAVVWGPDNDSFLPDPAAHAIFAGLVAKRYSNQAHVWWIPAGEYQKITQTPTGFDADGVPIWGVSQTTEITAEQKARYVGILSAIRANAHPQSVIMFHPDGWKYPSRDWAASPANVAYMLQPSGNVGEHIRGLEAERAATPTKPAINGESGYEGIA